MLFYAALVLKTSMQFCSLTALFNKYLFTLLLFSAYTLLMSRNFL